MTQNTKPVPQSERRSPVTVTRYIGSLAVHVSVPLPASDQKAHAKRMIEADRQRELLADRWLFHKRVGRLDEKCAGPREIPEFLRLRGVEAIK